MDKTQQSEYLQKLIAYRRNKAEECTLALLADLVGENLPYADVHYIDKRTREIVGNAIHKTVFANPEIARLRSELAKNMAATAIKNIEFLKLVKKPKDETEERDNRCESICHKMAKIVMDPAFVFDNEDYLKTVIADDDRLLLELKARGFMDSIYEVLINSIDESLRKCNEKLWGRPKTGITFRQIDLLLKQK